MNIYIICTIITVTASTITTAEIDTADDEDRQLDIIFGLVSGAWGIADSIYNHATGDNSQADDVQRTINSMYSAVLSSQSEMQKNFNNLAAMLAQSDYKKNMDKITTSVYEIKVSTPIKKPSADKIKEWYKAATKLDHNIQLILDGILGQSNGADLIKEIRNNLECYSEKIRRAVSIYMVHVQAGLGAFAYYAKVGQMPSSEMSKRKSGVIAKVMQVSIRLRTTMDNCLADYGSVVKEMTDVLNSNAAKTTTEVADILLAKMDGKYSTTKWLVLVYNGVSGFNAHCLTGNYHVFRIGGKNAAVFPIKNNAAGRVDGNKVHQSINEYLKVQSHDWIVIIANIAAEKMFELLFKNNAIPKGADLAVINYGTGLVGRASKRVNYFWQNNQAILKTIVSIN